jgi:hypothetical protein
MKVVLLCVYETYKHTQLSYSCCDDSVNGLLASVSRQTVRAGGEDRFAAGASQPQGTALVRGTEKTDARKAGYQSFQEKCRGDRQRAVSRHTS